MALHGRVAEAAEDLDDTLGVWPLHGMDGVDHAEERSAPRGDADDVAFAHRRLEVVRRGGADCREDRFFAILETLSDDRLVEVIPLTEGRLEFRIGASRSDDRDSHDAFLFGPLQETGDGRLGDMQALRDLRLLQPVLVIELGDARDHSKLVRSTHGSTPSCQIAKTDDL